MTYHYARAKDASVNEMVQRRSSTQQLIKDNLLKAQERMKWYAYKKRSDREFLVGDEVFLKLQPYRQHSLIARRNHKLSAKFYGPYAITEKIGKVAYRLALPVDSKLHNIFHVSQLKKKLGSAKILQTVLPGVTEESEMNPKPVAILSRKMIKKGNVPVFMVQVQWENGNPEEATWEQWYKLTKRFLDFHP
ncbi:uncharacterized protein LOC141680196 [Apium graveolens]|uniref:uncharacterized protein LOC141680196 n=1 Tax=Apium graveolens TaxID=4045 RepID=UPI003D795FD4